MPRHIPGSRQPSQPSQPPRSALRLGSRVALRLTSRLALRLASLLLPVSIAAQVPAAAAVTPEGWRWQTDRPASPRRGAGSGSDSTFEFSTMAPGWHVTMGPGGVLFDARERANGRFVVEAELILFPDASEEEYGVFVGGWGLDGGSGGWIAFVVRADGQVAVLRRGAGETVPVMGWGSHPAVRVRAPGESAKNVVTVRADADSVRFSVNGERVKAWSREVLDMDGAFGFRIGRGVNLHVTNLDVSRRMAPYPSRR